MKRIFITMVLEIASWLILWCSALSSVVCEICCTESFWHTLNIEINLHNINASNEPSH